MIVCTYMYNKIICILPVCRNGCLDDCVEQEADGASEAEEEGAYEVVPAGPRKVRGAAKARAVAVGTWVGRPRDRHRGVLRSFHKRAGTWLGRGPPGGGPSPRPSTAPTSSSSSAPASSSTGPP